jgi:DNA adenine methylase
LKLFPYEWMTVHCYHKRRISSRAIIFAGDYEDVIQNAQKGDFVYFDPPSDPVSYSSDFTAYTPNGPENQEQLANVFI